MRINQNISALNAWRNLTSTDGTMSKSLERLSSGLRINRAADDAAGLAISEKMRGQIKGLNQATRNAQDAISLIQTAEGALNETHSILQRMRELGVQSASDTATNEDRAQIQKEVDALAKEITRISNTSEFNTKNLLAGGFSNQVFQIGANKGQSIGVNIGAMDALSLGVAGNVVTATVNANNDIPLSTTNGLKNIGDGFTNGNYTIHATKTDAVQNGVTIESSTNALATMGLSTIANFTGSSDKTFTVKVDTVSAANGAVTGIKYSTDGGASYSNTVAVAANVVSVEGVTLTFGAANNNLNDQWNYSINAGFSTLQLLNGTEGAVGAQVGTDVKVYNNVTSATLGNAATSQTLDVSFLFSDFAVAGGLGEYTDFTLAVQNSTAAVTGLNGSITTDAEAKKGINVSTQAAADNAISVINTAMTKVSDQRSALGAVQNRLEHTIANLSTAAENLTAAESRIRDVDMASEMASFTRSQVLLQAGTAMMAQANQKPQGVLQLLR